MARLRLVEVHRSTGLLAWTVSRVGLGFAGMHELHANAHQASGAWGDHPKSGLAGASSR
jgi:hypothetical protein